MLVLAYDVTAGRAATGLFEGSLCLDERAEAMSRGHAERLFPMIEASLEAAGRVWADIDLIAVCTGPGNFTGARIGVAAARGLSLSTRAPAVGVDRFEALAEGLSGAICVALAAPGGMVHASRRESGVPVGDAATVTPEEAAALAAGATLIGDGAALVAAAGNGAPPLGPQTGDAPLAALATIALREKGKAPRPVPRYLRPAAAVLPKQAPPPILPPTVP